MNIKFRTTLTTSLATICLALASSTAFAQIVYESVKTKSGCSVSIDAKSLKQWREMPKYNVIREWSGACVDGVAVGRGTLTETLKESGEAGPGTVTQTTGQMHKGRFYGFSKSSVTSKIEGTADRIYWEFNYSDRMVRLDGLGLSGNDDLLADLNAEMPTESVSLRDNDYANIYDSQVGSLVLFKTACGLHKDKFPECGFGTGKPNYQVYRIIETPTGTDNRNATNTFCPSQDLSSCQPLLNSMVAPYVTSIKVFIKESIPKLADIDASIQKDLAEASQRQAAAAANKVKAAAQAASDLAAADKDFRDNLAKMNAGQLFAKADELSDKGDSAKAREVLRSLVSRFPDHPLAASAAQRMNAVVQTNAGGQTGNPSNPQSSSGGTSNSGNCDAKITAQDKEFEALDRRPLPAGAMPPAMRLMWIASERVNLIKANCPTGGKYQQMINEMQSIYQRSKTSCEQMTSDPSACIPNPYNGTVTPAMREVNERQAEQDKANVARLAKEKEKRDLDELTKAFTDLATTIQQRRSSGGGGANSRPCPNGMNLVNGQCRRGVNQ